MSFFELQNYCFWFGLIFCLCLYSCTLVANTAVLFYPFYRPFLRFLCRLIRHRRLHVMNFKAMFDNWRNYILAALTPLALSACASTAQPEIKYIIQKCTLPPARTQPFPADNLSPDADIFTQVKMLLMDRQERKADRTEREAAMEACR